MIGTAATIPMVIYDQMNNLWMPWVLPYISGLQPYMWAMVTARRKKTILRAKVRKTMTFV